MKKTILTEHDIHTGNLILVNQQYRYQKQCIRLGSVGEGENAEILFSQTAGIYLNRLMEEIGGWEQIAAVSAWRSEKEQQAIWDQSLHENGTEFTQKYVAIPGHSEHQTGLAVDLGFIQPGKQIDFIRPFFPYDGCCGLFRRKAASYGFVERYPKEKEQITKIAHEPWHFRYIGTPHAAIMEEHGFVLEEYLSFLRGYVYGRNPYLYRKDKEEYLVSYLKLEHTSAEITQDEMQSVSGNNIDGFIITKRRQRHEERQ